ncbi:replication-relaxation family protein [Streptomyces sp. SP18CS02]|uniref:replication-relaxation family protein n=1 Tax=Streptomyces sp. SP18CS02 TaxID=3002531 RepID=UPI002E7824E7|nr:replication-relaxation family protein [Streptomyces sp. SP18CS02]MEE1751248.1 replication-relaxation family protein [Streptomyces sp. SP18CS02]
MKKLAELGLAETNGKAGRHPIWNLAPAGQKALADGNELPPRPKAGTGAKAAKAGFGPHGVAVTDMILAFRGRDHLTDWQVEVKHAIKETGLSFNTDAVLAWPTKTSEVRLFEHRPAGPPAQRHRGGHLPARLPQRRGRARRTSREPHHRLSTLGAGGGRGPTWHSTAPQLGARNHG